MTNDTLKYEFQFIHYLNGKTFGQLSKKWQKHIKRIFPEASDDTIIHCSKHENYFAKGDIDIRIKGHKVIMSLKNGKNACMHRERFTWLYKDLKEMGLSREALNMITLYQFGSCIAYGHEEKPLTKEEIVEKYSELIFETNKELNKEDIVDKIIDRAVITGRKDYRQPIDYLYYGNLEKGILLSKKQIYKLIKTKEELSSGWLHFGQLTFQPAMRNRENEHYLESTIHWPILGKLFFETQDEDNVVDESETEEN